MVRPSDFIRDVRGASAVEFALVVVPLVLFMFGIFEFGRFLWTREALQSAVIAGARCVGVLQAECAPGGVYDADLAEAFVAGRAHSYYVPVVSDDIQLDVAATCSGVTGFAEVTINYTFSSALPDIFGMLDGQTLSASACFPNQPAST